jgi:cytochrome P450
MAGPQVAFADPKTQECPFSAYDELRREAPIYFDESTQVYVVTRYDDVRAIMLDPARFSSITGLVQTRGRREVVELYERKGWVPVPTLLNNDPPDHRFYRSIVDKSFGPARTAALESYIQRNVTEIIDAFIGSSVEVEFVKACALRLPLFVIMDLVGVPREMYDSMFIWAEAGPESTNPNLSPAREIELVEISIEFQRYIANLAESYRRRPADNLLSDLANASLEGRSLNMAEIVSLVQMLMSAGYDTTTSTISSCMAGLIDKPELQEQLRGDAKRIATYGDEILRLYAPLQGLFRKATEDIRMHGVTIPKGAIVNPRWGAANRDSERFPNGNQLDISRTNLNQSVVFGAGIHTCVGRALARTEVRITLEHLLNGLKDIRYARGDRAGSWVPRVSFVTWGPRELYIRFDRR